MKQTFGSLAILGLIFGVILAVLGWQQYTLLAESSPTAQAITLDDLERNGFGKNAYVQVTNVDYSIKFVYETKGKSGTWTSIWIPLVPSHSVGNQSYASKVIVHTSKPKDLNSLEQYCRDNRSVTGMIVNSIKSLGNKERDQLKIDHPNIDFNKVLILEEGQTPPNRSIVFLMLAAGVVLVVLGIVFGVAALIVQS